MVLLFCEIFPQIDTMADFDSNLHKNIGDDYLKYHVLFNKIKYYIEINPAIAKSLFPSFYETASRIATKHTSSLPTYFYLKGKYDLSQGKHVSALDDYSMALNILFKNNSVNPTKKVVDLLGFVIIDMGNLYYGLGIYNSAEKCYKEAQTYFSPASDGMSLATCFNNIGLVYEKKQMFDSAFYYFMKAYSIRTSLEPNNTFLAGHSQKYIARIFLKKENYDSSAFYLNKSISNMLPEKIFWAKQVLSEDYLLYSKLMILKNNSLEALKYLKLSEELFIEIKDSTNLSNTYTEIAQYYSDKKQYKSALDYAFRALKVGENKSFDYKLRTLFQISKIYSLLGNKTEEGKYLGLYDSLSSSSKNSVMESAINALQDAISVREAMFTEEFNNQALKSRMKIYSVGGISLLLIVVFVALIVYYKYVIIKRNEKQLLETKDQLTELNSIKDKFFSIIAHDLKSPFVGLLGYSQLLYDNYDSMDREEIKGMTDSIYNISKDTFILLENLLEWSRLQHNAVHFSPNELNLNAVLNDTFRLLTESAKKKEIEIINQIGESDKVFADTHMLKTIIRNLVSNAIKFSDLKSAITISSRTVKDKVELSIIDNGIGMGEDKLAVLFDLGSQTSTKGTSGERGTGLGLQICKEFAEKNNGTISVSSEIGKGSKFVVTLPAVHSTNQTS